MSHTVEAAENGDMAWVYFKSPQAKPDDPTPPVRRTGDGCVTDPSLPQGYVTVNTKPYSKIFWGDKQLGWTPLARFPLPSGCIRLKAVTDDGRSKTVKLKIVPNKVSIYRFTID